MLTVSFDKTVAKVALFFCFGKEKNDYFTLIGRII